MAKPSVTNIKPPSKTAVWVPPKTTWDLNDNADIISAGNSFAAEGTTQYDTLTDSINEPAPEAVNFGFEDYDYVFFGVNGGENETVRAMDNGAGVIVTGNGKDVITGERWVLNSDVTGKTVVYEKPADADLANYTFKSAGEMLVFAGNGSDYVHGGAANDILFGENGPDTLNGGADTGTATFEEPDEGQDIILVDLIDKIADGTLAPGSGHFQAGNGPNAGDYVDNVGSLHKVGVYQDGGDFYNLFYYDPEDLPVEDVLDSQHISVWLYDDYGSTPTYLGSWDLMENQQVYFGVNINDHPNSVHVVVFHDEPTPEMLANPQHNWLHQQSTDLLAEIVDHEEGNTPLPTFEAGDQLIGGNGPDQFVWDAADTNNVDLIWDYNQGDGTYDPLEGDTLLLIGVTDYTTFMKDLDGDTVEDLVIYVGENQAIGLVGITDINQVTFG